MEYSGNLRILLWVLAEMTIIASDIPEVVGTSIALNILFGIPLWIGVVITSISVFLFLMINLFGVRKLELFIGLLIFIVLFCFLIEMFLSPISIRGFFSGFIPTIQPGSMFSITALIGAVVMPHNLYLHSALVQSRKFGRSVPELKEACRYNAYESFLALSVSLVINLAVISISAADFFPRSDVGLSSAPELLDSILGGGKVASIVFAIALLASGQSSTMTGTYAGQFVMEGFLDLSIPQWSRATITRGFAILPSLSVALIAGEKGADALIVFSQAILSVLLPFSLIPLLKVTNSSLKMRSFANSWLIKVVTTILGCFVTAANLVLVFSSIAPFIRAVSLGLRTLIYLLTSLLGIAYVTLLIYLIRRPLSSTALFVEEESSP